MSEVVGARLLILETSGRVGWVAVAEGPRLAGVRRLDEGRRNARDLAPAVADLLRGQGWRPAQVEAVLVSRGPGSYTGLRVGVMSAKAFAYATGCAVLGIDTLAAVAEQAPPEAGRLEVIADAQQDRIYVQPFGRGAGGSPATEQASRLHHGWQPLAALAIRPFADWLTQLPAGAWVSGPGLHKWDGRLPAEVARVPADRRDPEAGSLLRLGLARYLAGQRDDLWSLEPLYLRPSSAEEQWQARGKGP